MLKIAARAAAVAFAAALLVAQAQAQQPSDEEVGSHVMGDTLATFLHELGHAVIEELQLPAVGPEEDIADEFSTVVLLAIGQGDPAGYEALLAVAQGFLDIWDFRLARDGTTVDALPFWDEHGLDVKRATRILCLVYGSDTVRFAALADRLDMPDKQKDWLCQREFERTTGAWDRLMEPHLWPDGTQPPADAPGFSVAYGEATSEASRRFEAILRENRVYEQLAEGLNALIRLPRPITIVLAECGEPNAQWSPKNKTITMCYEWMQFIGELYIARAQGQIGTVGRTTPQGLLAGVWQGQGSDIFGMPALVQTVLQPNGEFSQTVQSNSGVNLRIWGRWSAGPDAIDFRITGWQPREFCGPLGCSPVSLGGGERVPYRLVDANTMQSGPITFYRVQ